MLVREVKAALQQGKGNLRCDEVARLLAELGFEVRDGKRGGHKIFVHDGLQGFYSSSYNCGHGKNPEIKPKYISNIIKLIDEHYDALRCYLGEEAEGGRS